MTHWQSHVMRANNARAGAWRSLIYALFAIAFALCDVAEAVRERPAPGNQREPRP